MGAFDTLNAAAQEFAEEMMGETFSYRSPAGVVTSGLVGVFNQVSQDFQFDDFSVKQVTTYTVVSSKTQWGSVVPGDNGQVIDSSGGTYDVNQISGTLSAGEPAYEITLNKLT